jgi:hypothetical protein
MTKNVIAGLTHNSMTKQKNLDNLDNLAKILVQTSLLKTQPPPKNINKIIASDFQSIKNMKWDFMYIYGKSY